MKNKYLTVGIIPLLLLLGVSCKKQDSVILEKKSKLLNKTDLIGNWVPYKIETTIIDKEGTKSTLDSSIYVKSYVLGYSIKSDHLVYNNKGSNYKLSELDNKQFLEYELYGFTQKLMLLKLTSNILVLQHSELIGTIKKNDIIYFNKLK